MAEHKTYLEFGGKIIMLGCGSIGQGTLPLLLRHLAIRPDQIEIITDGQRGIEVASEYGVPFHAVEITRDNYQSELGGRLKEGDFLLNVSVNVSSVALIEMCQAKGVSYLDTCIEPWPGGYTDLSLTPSQRSNYALRETALAVKKKYPGGPTTVITHGANPGLVTHFIKEALLNIARDTGHSTAVPTDRAGWAGLMRDLGVRVIHVAERDTQVSAKQPKEVGEFVNTWSIDGFVSEGCQPAELGWGTHERTFPGDGGKHDFGSGAAIYLNRPGAGTRVRTWTPLEGPFHGFLVTHSESISTADYFSVFEGGEPVFRPTVHYAYHPCDDAVLSLHEMAGKNWVQQDRQRLMMEEITFGIDELGVLLMGHKNTAYWYGSRLDIHEARRLAPHNNATSLQVTAPAMAGLIWALENPGRGVVEPEELDHQRILEITRPYLGPVVGEYSDWTPLKGRSQLFPEARDESDPWQFINFRVF